MSNNYRGYLLKNAVTNALFDKTWMEKGGWNSTPNQRAEIEADRDDYTQNLIRVTANGLKTKITISTIKHLNLDTKIAIQNFFKTAVVKDAEETKSILQRKVKLTYWNDEDNCYKTSFFYEPDINFVIEDHDDSTITYSQISISLVEY